MNLSKRLSMNASFVSRGMRLADVGTDHGYVPIHLVQEGVIPSAIAMDINQGPLDRAKEHIKEFHLESCIHTRLSDGLQRLQPGEADSVLIAGMGGALMIKILTEGKSALETVREIILQPQSEIDKVRYYLENNGYRIVDENIVFEDGKYYPAMKAERGIMHYDRKMDYLYGRILLEKKHPVLKEYLEQRNQVCRNILHALEKNGKKEERLVARIQEVKEEMQQIQAAMDCYEM